LHAEDMARYLRMLPGRVVFSPFVASIDYFINLTH
jgi:hypothetical protein